ncbi:hypothetical protein GCM10023184_29320 [Flaviaesturariibacter amylovorans]|uniref:Uncharacterized protein n=1 Tax=Flaviaesturariibacter amylovorans TaxID=1084520 RepID=A0ABP8H640_9BACT
MVEQLAKVDISKTAEILRIEKALWITWKHMDYWRSLDLSHAFRLLRDTPKDSVYSQKRYCLWPSTKQN